MKLSRRTVTMLYEKKVALLNQALIDIGMGPFQWKVCAMTGFGWFVDNNLAPVRNEFSVERIAFLTVAKYAGLVVGSSVWPITADFIGRRLAFNVTLLISAVSGLVGAGSPNFVAISTFCAFIGLGTGGNQPVDSAIFLEYIPATHQYLLIMQSALWSVGQAVAALIAWPLIANFSCSSQAARCQGLDSKAVDVVQKIAGRNGGTTWLTLAHFEEINAQFEGQENTDVQGPNQTDIISRSLEKYKPEKLRTLFSTPRLALSTTLLFLWCSIGMAYPLYNSFIPIFLEHKGVSQGDSSISTTYRNYAIQAVCGIPASLLGGFTVDLKRIGRKGTGTLACLGTGIFLFLFTRASAEAGVIGFTCAIAFFQNLVYGLLYSYTPELFPAPVRGTANGLVALFNRLSGLMAPIIAAYIGIETDVPVWISAALFLVAGVVFLILPYETRGKAAA
ncbi:MFS general substrate transporter [Aspergillus steynii IBT 23096]|uniref:MFS general substrate transporter n=1 Tax=Aspergillus steynii IBT 23096 TaxID=1392250 RepID=A0A2I2GA09_9EURO|nr:MFS general substrate transporter [Aspergillus steynii IBT 23096]PLB49714.1 MFS general substrate transporter [Aspergillus steynii IBT 23096]